MNKKCILLVSIILSACAPSGSLMRKSLLVSAGTSKHSVLTVMGVPGNRQFNKNMEAWQYCEGDYTGLAGDDVMIIWFQDSLVSGITTYKNWKPGLSCDVGFTQINWEERPNFTLEVRNR